MGGAVGITQRLLQLHARLVMGFHREGEPAARRQHAGNGGGDRRKIAAIDKDIGREHKVVLSAGFAGEEFHLLGDDQTVINSLGARLLNHPGGNIDAHQPVAMRPKRRAAKTGAAAKIEHRAEPERPSVYRPQRFEQKLRPTILEPLDQRPIEIRRVLVEQPPT